MKYKNGDIFKISVDNESFAFGQIVNLPSKDTLAVIVFKYIQKGEAQLDIKKLIQSEILFFANTFDAKLYHNDWQIVANHTDNITNISFPYYKLGTRGEGRLQSYNKSPIGDLLTEEFDLFDYRKMVAPVRVENAVKAYYNILPWVSEDYDSLKYERMEQSVLNAKKYMAKLK